MYLDLDKISKIEKANKEINNQIKNIEERLDSISNYNMSGDLNTFENMENDEYDCQIEINKNANNLSNHSRRFDNSTAHDNLRCKSTGSHSMFSNYKHANSQLMTTGKIKDYVDIKNNKLNYLTQKDESNNRKFHILFREMANFKSSKPEIKIINDSLLSTRKMIFHMKEVLENKLKEFEQILYSNLDLDIDPLLNINKEINLLPNEKDINNMRFTSNFNSSIAALKTKKQEIFNNLFKSISLNSKEIETIQSKLNCAFKNIEDISTNLNNFQLRIEERVSSTEENINRLFNELSLIEMYCKNNDEKLKNLISLNEKNSKDYKFRLDTLENKFTSNIKNIEENIIKTELGKLEDRLSDYIVKTKNIIEDKFNKQIKRDFDNHKNNILSEVNGSLWERKKNEVKLEISQDILDTESKLNRKFNLDVDNIKNELTSKIVDIKDSLIKLESNAASNNLLSGNSSNNNNNIQNKNISPILFNNIDYNYKAAAFQNTNISPIYGINTVSNNMLNSVSSNNSLNNRTKISYISNKKLAKNEIKDFIVEHSDDNDDDILSNRNSRHENNTSKSKIIFNRLNNK